MTPPSSIKNCVMTLIPAAEMKRLLKSGSEGVRPIVKLFGGPLTWLVTGVDESGTLWGFGDLSMGCVEFGTLCHISELPTLKTGIAYIERDRFFEDDPSVNWFDKETLAGC
jgi:hypothetical protein